VDVKQRVADVLDIDALDLDKDRWYALSAHFDFVIWRDNEPQFAVEFDERHHFTDAEQIIRDEKKNAICEKAMFPLLRIEASTLKRVGDTPVVEWLADLFFVYHDLWLPARAGWEEEEGYDPDDWDDDLYAEAREHDRFDYRRFGAIVEGRGVPEFSSFAPHDPFHEARHAVTLRAMADWSTEYPAWWGMAMPVQTFIEKDQVGRDVGHVVLPVGPEGVIVGTGRCWNPGFMFIADHMLGEEVAIDLALQQLAEFVELNDRGRLIPMPWPEAEQRLSHLERGAASLATLSQQDHREISYRKLRKWGLPHEGALLAAYSIEWDDDGRLKEPDEERDSFRRWLEEEYPSPEDEHIRRLLEDAD
jgi:hypothetical protein